MNKKGFTLVELLAVIVVLAILALLAIPRVISIMEKSRVSAFTVEANEIIKSAQNAYGSKVLSEEEMNHPVCFTIDQLIKGGYLDKDKDDVKGVIVIDLIHGSDIADTNEVIYTYLSKTDFYIRKNDGIKNKVVNSDVVKSKGAAIYSDCTTTCTATDGGVSVKCGDTEITGIVSSPVEEACDYERNHEWIFSYKGSIDEFEVPCGGYYKLEVWGAQGGSYSDTYHGGYGGYAVGSIHLTNTDKLYVGVGGRGTHVGNFVTGDGGYNGGGAVTGSWSDQNERRSTGGGATHIALNNNLGELKHYSDHQSDVLIVAGGGGGGHANQVMITSSYYTGGFGVGGSGGGTTGGMALGQQYDDPVTARGGWQEQTPSETRGSFGQGGQAQIGETNYGIYDGAGAGWYGGERSWRASGGGSGHLSTSLINGHMSCFNCMETEDSVTTNVNSANATATSGVPKKDDGYAKITYLGGHL